MDEIAAKKTTSLLTIILNCETGQVFHVGEERKYEILKACFDSLNKEQKHSIEAIVMDTRDPYIKAVKE